MGWQRTALALGLLGLAAQAACSTRPAEERAERDQEVGHAEARGLRVDVDDGLAVILGIGEEAGEGTLSLWNSAPVQRFTLNRSESAPTSWRVTFSNVMRESQLKVVEGEATLTQLPGTHATQQVYQLTLTTPEVRFELMAPEARQRGPFSFALLSDVQEAIDRVQDIFGRINQEPVSFMLGAGDLTNQGSDEQLSRYKRELQKLEVPYYTTLGNHELGQSPTLWHDYFGRASFHFDFRGAAFSLIDSGSATVDPLVYDQLGGWLSEHTSDVHIVAMHIPPLDPTGVRNGAFSSRNEAAKLLGRLARGHVDLTLYGHIHSYYDFENGGIPAYISGGGGAIPERFDQIGRHFLVIDVDPDSGIRKVRTVRVD
ncbi:MAG: metallophosphoesterase [Polyangiaceae bacterium]|nr:metallophosphoesterase [Myxococcales bacterium]MCB9587352.1 metallophosphoesterase [Polyangiaceae bacterium]MCB9605851.1 metallophosphoesterase [Polyangiaceae bacterium]